MRKSKLRKRESMAGPGLPHLPGRAQGHRDRGEQQQSSSHREGLQCFSQIAGSNRPPLKGQI